MEVINELLGYENIKIYQRQDMFSFSIDSMLLASFIEIKNTTKKIIDLGCGNAPIPLFLTLKTKAHITGVELQQEVFDLAKKSVEINNFGNQIDIINDNIKDIYKSVGPNTFDIAVSNPPYFKYLPTSNINKNDFLTIARHEVEIKLEDIIVEAKKLLSDGGSLYMVHRCERLTEVTSLLSKHNFGLKRIRFIYPKKDSKSALLFLFEARYNKKADVIIEQPLFVYNNDKDYTEEVLEIFNFKNKYQI